MKKPFKKWFFYIFFALLWSACNQDCQNKTKENQIVKQITEQEELKEKIFAPRIISFPHLDFTHILENQKESLISFFNDEICPCGCPKTFAQCIEMPKGCKSSVLLAQWAIDQLKKGAPEKLLLNALTDEINKGFNKDPIIFDYKDAYFKGNPKASMTIVEFADFECPACKYASKELSSFLKDHKDKVRLYFIHFPLSTHPHAEFAAIAAEAAGKQGKFWEMHDLLFDCEDPLTESKILSLASKIFSKVQLKQFSLDLKDKRLAEKVLAQKNYAQRELKISATPSIFFNGRPFNLGATRENILMRLRMEDLRDEISCD